MLRQLTASLFNAFAYEPQSTRVDSPIDDALKSRQGVCQDFAHVMIALVRTMGVPCRYVSGYLFHRADDHDRSTDGATHAWAEALLPDLGWVGFDPTNNLIASDRHVRVAVGRDYDDVPPTRGVYQGTSGVRAELAVAVTVGSVVPTGGRVAPLRALDVEAGRGAVHRSGRRPAAVAPRARRPTTCPSNGLPPPTTCCLAPAAAPTAHPQHSGT